MSTTDRLFATEHEQFRSTVREFLAREVAPHHERWEREGIVDRSIYVTAAAQGVLGFMVPEEFGGLGVEDFRYNAIVTEETFGAGLNGPALTLHNDVIAQYLIRLATAEQKARWLPGFASGALTFAIAMTEPDAGSDLAGIRSTAHWDGQDWILNGQKTYISNGIHSDVVIVVARTDPDAGHKGISLLVVERGMRGFERGRNLDKMGLHAQDTAELFFSDVRVPAENVLGQEGRGFYHLMENLPAERLSIAISSAAIARRTFETTLEYCRTRTAFRTPIGSFQANRFALAEMATELDIARVYLDDSLARYLAGRLTAVDAAKAKWWVTEMTKRMVDRCVQLHGGYGYMRESAVAKAYVDVRIETVFGGTTEIMKEIIGRDLRL
jgi:alkylation response protein AidB-like acyl-CoA dehydrogenase